MVKFFFFLPWFAQDGLKIKRIEIVEFGEGEDAGEGQQDVEHEHQQEVGKDEPVDVTLLVDRGDE